MKNILFVCSLGMSTNMFVAKMLKSAKDMKFDANIWASSDMDIKENIEKADVILLAPQVRYLCEKLKRLVKERKPILTIDVKDYSTMNSKKVLESILKVND